MFLTLDEVLKKHEQKLLKLNLFFSVLISIYSINKITYKIKLFTNILISSVFAVEH